MADTKATIDNGRIRIASVDEIGDEVIKAGVPVLDADDGYVRIGDGTTQYADLPYFTMSGTPKAPVVNPDEPMKDIVINLGQNSYYMNVGDEEKLTIEVYPVDSSIVVSVESLSSIVSVRNENDNWYITAEEGGGATVVVSARGSGYNTAKATISVVVNDESYNTFADASWEEISEVAESGKASEIYNIGDEKEVLWNGSSVKIRIVSFDHYDKADGSGKAGIVCQTVNCLPNVYYVIADSSSSGGGYDNGYWDTGMYTDSAPSILAGFESDLQAVIKEVSIPCIGGYNDSSHSVSTHSASVFLPALAEIYSTAGLTTNCSCTGTWYTNYEQYYTAEASQFEYYKEVIGDADAYSSNSGAVKYNGDNSTSTCWWWVRTPDVNNSGDWFLVYGGGDFDDGGVGGSSLVAPCFCI